MWAWSLGFIADRHQDKCVSTSARLEGTRKKSLLKSFAIEAGVRRAPTSPPRSTLLFFIPIFFSSIRLTRKRERGGISSEDDRPWPSQQAIEKQMPSRAGGWRQHQPPPDTQRFATRTPFYVNFERKKTWLRFFFLLILLLMLLELSLSKLLNAAVQDSKILTR